MAAQGFDFAPQLLQGFDLEAVELFAQPIGQAPFFVGQLLLPLGQAPPQILRALQLFFEPRLHLEEFGAVAFELFEHAAQVAVFGAEQLLGAIRPRLRQPQALRQGERFAAAGRPGQEPVGGVAGFDVELHGGAKGAFGLERKGRHLGEVGGHQDHGPAGEQTFEQGDAQGGAFFRVGPRTELVEHHQGVFARFLPRFAQAQQPARKGGAVGQHVLVVAHRGHHRGKKWHAAARCRRQRHATLVQQGKKGGGFEGDRFAAGIRAGDHQRAALVRQLEIERGDAPFVALLAERLAPQLGKGGIEQGMAGLQQHDFVHRRDIRQVAARSFGKTYTGLQKVELAEQVGMIEDRRQVRAQKADHLEQDAGLFGLLVFDRLLQLVVAFHRVERLEVETFAAARTAMHQARHLAAGARLQYQHQPPATHGDGFFGKVLAVGFHRPGQLVVDALAGGADAPAQLGEARGGVFADFAAPVEGFFELAGQLLERRHLRAALAEGRAGGIGKTDTAEGLAGGFDHGADFDQLAATEILIETFEAAQDRLELAFARGHEVAVGEQPQDLFVAATAHAEGNRVARGAQCEQPLTPKVGGRALGQQGQEGRKFERPFGGFREDHARILFRRQAKIRRVVWRLARRARLAHKPHAQ